MTCPIPTNQRHKWQTLGLDIDGNGLVELYRCLYCNRRQSRPFHNDIHQRHYGLACRKGSRP